MWRLPVRLSLETAVLALVLTLGAGALGWWNAGRATRGAVSYALHMGEPPERVAVQPAESGQPAQQVQAAKPVQATPSANRPAAQGPPVNPVAPTVLSKGTGGPSLLGTGGTPSQSLTTGGLFAWPLIAEVSSYYGPRWGRFHAGIDLAANMGDSIKASRDGVVVLAGEVTDYGLTVIIQHPDGTSTLYGHSSKLLVRKGQKVKRGEFIALVGSTGRSTGPHLHFEIRVNDQARNPLEYLP